MTCIIAHRSGWMAADKGTYRKLVQTLIEAGIVQESHLNHLDTNGMTTLRLPNVKKPPRARNSE